MTKPYKLRLRTVSDALFNTGYQVRVPTAANQRRLWQSSPQCRRSYPTTAVVSRSTASGSKRQHPPQPQKPKQHQHQHSLATAKQKLLFLHFQFGNQLRISPRRAMLLLRSAYVAAAAQAPSALSTPGARHLDRGGLTRAAAAAVAAAAITVCWN